MSADAQTPNLEQLSGSLTFTVTHIMIYIQGRAWRRLISFFHLLFMHISVVKIRPVKKFLCI